MTRNTTLMATTLLVAGLTLASPARPSPMEHPLPIPQSLRVQHGEILEQVSAMAEKPGPVGPEARHLQTLLVAHMKYVEDVILPPLTLLPTIASSDVGPDMKWALPLVERAQAERGQQAMLQEQLTDQLVEVFGAAQSVDDTQTVKRAQDIAAWLEGEGELTQPAVQLVGKYLRLRYTSGS